MVAKISSGGSLGSALGYNINKVKEEKAEVLATNRIFVPLDKNYKTSDILNDFEIFMPERYRTENPVFHVSLNPHPDDKLTDVELTAIAEEYIERMGYGDQPYLIFKHNDITRGHIHIVSTRVKEDGSKINDKFERRKSKAITRDLEQRYGLRTAEKRSKREDLSLEKVDVSRGNVKDQVASVVRGVGDRYHFISFSEYRALLSDFNICAEELKGLKNGKPFNGVVYSVTDDGGNKVGNPFGSATLGRFAGVEKLTEKYAKSKEFLGRTSHTLGLRRKVVAAVELSSNREELKENLKRENVTAILRVNKDGRLYGVTFIDHNTGVVLNGSRLGKEYAANAIDEQLNAPKISITQQPTYHRDTTTETPTTNIYDQEQTTAQSINDDNSSGVLSIFDIPTPSSGADQDDIDNAEMARNLQQKKKRRGMRM